MRQAIRSSVAACGVVLLLAACGEADGPAQVAANACAAQVTVQLGGRPFRLDRAALAASIADDGRGGRLLTAPVVVDAALASESTQQLECTARLAEDGGSAVVLNVRFIW